MVSLICEGSCNPDVDHVDALVFAAAVKAKGEPPIGNRALWDRQRKLKYTAHAETGYSNFYRCLVCGRARRFGNDKGSHAVNES